MEDGVYGQRAFGASRTLGIAYAAVENRVCERLSWLGIGGLSSTKRVVSHLAHLHGFVRNFPLKAKSPGSSPGNATK